MKVHKRLIAGTAAAVMLALTCGEKAFLPFYLYKAFSMSVTRIS